MKIAFLLSDLGGGGLEKTVLTLGTEFSCRPEIDEVHYVLFDTNFRRITEIPPSAHIHALRPPSNFLKKMCSWIASLRWWTRFSTSYKLKSFRKNVQLLDGLQTYLRRESPDLIFSHKWFLTALTHFAIERMNCPSKIVAVEHGETMWRGMNPQMRTIVRYVYPRLDAIVAIANGTAELVRHAAEPKELKIEIIYNPIVPNNVGDLASEPSCDWLDHKSAPVILYVGRLVRNKDLPTLFSAFSRVRDEMLCRLIVVGEAEDSAYGDWLVTECKRIVGEYFMDIRFVGTVKNPFSWMVRADVLALCSLSEGMPTVVVEALAVGTPVVATDCSGGLREALGEGKYGRIVPKQSVESLAEGIRHSLTKTVNKNTLRKRSEAFSVQHSTKSYMELVRRLTACASA